MLVRVDLAAPAAPLAHRVPQPSARAARAGPRRGRRAAGDQRPQLAALVQLPDILGAAHEPPADEDAGEGQPPAAQDALQLRHVPGVHRQVALVHGDAEPAEDRQDGAAVLEGLADHAEACEVDNDGGLLLVGGAGRELRLEGRGGGATVVVVMVEGGWRWRGRIAVGPAGDPDPVENGGGPRGVGFGVGLIGAEVLDVLEGRAGEAP